MMRIGTFLVSCLVVLALGLSEPTQSTECETDSGLEECIMRMDLLQMKMQVDGSTAEGKRKLSSEVRQASTSADCSCMKWNDTYAVWNATYGKGKEVKCGSKVEFFVAGGSMEDAFCDDFFSEMPNNLCVNVNMGADMGQWCYVDSSCSSLNGGAQTDFEGMSWKMCDMKSPLSNEDRYFAGEDMIFRTEKVASILTCCGDSDYENLLKLAYPMDRDHLWKDVSAFWNVPSTALANVSVPEGTAFALNTTNETFQSLIAPRWGNDVTLSADLKAMSADLRQKLEAIKDMDKPYVFNTNDGISDPRFARSDPPFVIVEGDRVSVYFGNLICVSDCHED